MGGLHGVEGFFLVGRENEQGNSMASVVTTRLMLTVPDDECCNHYPIATKMPWPPKQPDLPPRVPWEGLTVRQL